MAINVFQYSTLEGRLIIRARNFAFIVGHYNVIPLTVFIFSDNDLCLTVINSMLCMCFRTDSLVWPARRLLLVILWDNNKQFGDWKK